MLDQVKLNNIKYLLYVYLHFFSLAMVGAGDVLGAQTHRVISASPVGGEGHEIKV
jgi:hypothetical protein